MVSVDRIYLIGLMGAGKSTVGRKLAEALDWHLLDLDQEVEKLAGHDIPMIFKEQGEAKFREYESQVLLATAQLKKTIIPCGGGVVTTTDNLEYLKEELTIWLDVSPEEAASRLESSQDRPLLDGCKNTYKKLTNLLESRQSAYALASSMHIETENKVPETITNEILENLRSSNVRTN